MKNMNKMIKESNIFLTSEVFVDILCIHNNYMLNIPEIALPKPNLIDNFYNNLLKHPRCSHFSEVEKKMILDAWKIAEDFHKNEFRKVSWEPYITHPIALVYAFLDSKNIQWEKNRRRYPIYKSIIILLLHDTLESYPEGFEEIYNLVWMDIFCRVLKLSQLTLEYRKTIHDFLFEKLVHFSESQKRKYSYALYMLSHDPTRKEIILTWKFKNDKEEFDRLCDSYRTHLDEYCTDLSPEKKEKEIDWLWHYLFFDPTDARHKVIDTINNLSDLKDMKEKEDYKLRRIPKLLALKFVLDRYDMTYEVDMLLQIWTSESVWWKEHQIMERRKEKQKYLLDYTSLIAEQLHRISRITDGVKIIQENTRKFIRIFR